VQITILKENLSDFKDPIAEFASSDYGKPPVSLQQPPILPDIPTTHLPNEGLELYRFIILTGERLK
jgi:hypothetical protein